GSHSGRVGRATFSWHDARASTHSSLGPRNDRGGSVNAAAARGALLVLALSVPLVAPAVSAAQAPPRVSMDRVPLGFEQNRGQVDGRVRFVARADGYDLFLTRSAAVLGHDGRGLLRLGLAGASGSAAPAGVHRLATRTTYVRGAGRGSLAVPSFAGVRYRGVYPGVDLVYHARGSRLEYDFRLAPYADARAIRLAVSG